MGSDKHQVRPEEPPGFGELSKNYWKQAGKLVFKWLLVFIMTVAILFFSRKSGIYYELNRWAIIVEFVFLAAYLGFKSILFPFHVATEKKENFDSETRRATHQQGILNEILDETKSMGSLMDLLQKNLAEKIKTAEQNYSVEYYSLFWDNVDELLVSFHFLSQCHQRLKKHEEVYSRLLLHKAHSYEKYTYPAYDKAGINKIIYQFEVMVSAAERNEKFATIKDQRSANLNINSGFNSIESILIKMNAPIRELVQKLKLDVSTRMDIAHENRKSALSDLAEM